MRVLVLDVRASSRAVGTAYGGIDRLNKMLPELVRMLRDVDVVIEKDRIKLPQARHIFKFNIIRRKPWRFWITLEIVRLLKYVTEINSRYRYDLILSPGISGINELVCFLMAKLGLKGNSKTLIIFHHKNPYSSRLFPRSLREFGEWFDFKLLNFTLRYADGIITVSRASKQDLVSMGIPASKIFVTGNYIDYEKLEKYYVNHLNMLRGKRTLFDCCFAGRMFLEKGIFDLIEIFKRLKPFFPDVKVAVVGAETPLKHKWKKVVTLNGLDRNFKYFGQVEKARLYEVLASSKVFVFPSHAEGWGIAVAEAMALGLSVVAWDIPALREVFGNAAGVFLVREYNYEGFVEALIKLLNDDLMLEKLCKMNRRYSRRFNRANVVPREICAIQHVARGC